MCECEYDKLIDAVSTSAHHTRHTHTARCVVMVLQSLYRVKAGDCVTKMPRQTAYRSKHRCTVCWLHVCDVNVGSNCRAAWSSVNNANIRRDDVLYVFGREDSMPTDLQTFCRSGSSMWDDQTWVYRDDAGHSLHPNKHLCNQPAKCQLTIFAVKHVWQSVTFTAM